MQKADAAKSSVLAKIRRKGFVISGKNIYFAIYVAVGFFLGRVLVFEYMNPAVVAYLSIFLASGAAFYVTALAALGGLVTNVTNVALVEYLGAIALLGMANYYIIQNKKSITNIHRALIGTCCILIGGGISAILNSMSVYHLILTAVEALVTFSLTFIFITAQRAVISEIKNPMLNNEQLISISIVLGLVFVGMADIEAFGIYLRDVLSLVSVLLLSYAGGATIGCTSGLIFSVIMFTGAKYSAAYTGILGAAGIMGGIFRDFEKPGTSTGFLLGGLITTLFLDRTMLSREYLITFAVSALIFIALPKNMLERIALAFSVEGAAGDSAYLEKYKEIASERLNGYSSSFKLLSETFTELTEKTERMTQKEVSRLIDKIAENVCKSCAGFDSCWKNSFYQTYQAIFLLLSSSDKRGFISKADIPENFKASCVDLDGFVEIANRIFLIYKTDVKWHGKIAESRELISQQLLGISRIMADTSEDFMHHMHFSQTQENMITEQLQKMNIGVDSLIVLENKHGRYEVDLTSKSGTDMRTYGKRLLSAVSSALGRKMIREHSIIMGKNGGMRVRLVEKQPFNALTGVSRSAKRENGVSGDSYTWTELRDGRCMVALSDGMGSGRRANDESKAAIDILEQFLDSGFDKELAIKMINSVLLLKSDEDFFTTLDLLCIDLYTGVAEIVKIGAAETFLLRGGKVRIIRQSSLPVGILSNLSVETAKINLKDGDIILIVSDGVTDAIRQNSDNNWLSSALLEYEGIDPQELADYIVSKAKSLSGGEIKDDMTAIALRIYKSE